MASVNEDFSKFFEYWLAEQDRYLQALREAAAAAPPQTAAEEAEEEGRLRMLIERVVEHYEYYYKMKSESAKRDVGKMFTPTWMSLTEKMFLWSGGWRPSAAFHILYSKSGLQFEPRMEELIRGLETRDLADLSPEQLGKVDELQRRVLRAEKEISEVGAMEQEKVASSDMVDVTHAITGMMEEGEQGKLEMMEPEMKRRREGMERVLERADGLRMETIREVVEILRPMQAVHFLIAAAELHLRVHDFGVVKDAAAAERNVSE
ncbi:hypothetical protein J5N97_014816 [Dioscorea zingiberensis]|uniref:DOG1 domain-containing protein n=1 Tax=Dioscorea zingiberensis TaxID=325984 RepID=A0A9D5CUN6_9LILI|nr:hypothetical protein J5N97_014816 [Dioscorea zingiberensis]